MPRFTSAFDGAHTLTETEGRDAVPHSSETEGGPAKPLRPPRRAEQRRASAAEGKLGAARKAGLKALHRLSGDWLI